MEKYIQSSNPTDQEVDLSTYTLLVKNFGGNNQAVVGKFAESRITLTGKLAAGASLVLRHQQTTVYTSGTIADFSFNGNDPISLLKDGKVIDHIGNGSEVVWLEKDKPAGADILLHRKATISQPSATFLSEQWDRITLTRENQSNSITQYLGKR